ncbi:N-acetylmuramoyl-L-alanine amidase [Eubacterium multiforme]|uniref:N-acetylmuramoyl-L-alanine amidase n=1 Tax=Eubacterium multiforme TaxID=83339 RepID=A0ABT9USR4_9FIRM|nr:N-acetylmuramoyl-L-alanine amidase [Eubacterium multiforme]MDQ0149365.1 N-acetyl-anhydromuramyl-L-alanine amidase AmpD [Eubacterium multiforme]
MVLMKRRIDPDDHYNGRNAIKYIVVHDTGNKTDSDEGNANYFCTGTRNASAHYFVDDDSITQVVEEYNGAWHCGDGHGVYGIDNRNSLGIEMCRRNNEVTSKTIENTIWLVKRLQDKYNVSDNRVVRHYDASRKICPEALSHNNWAKWRAFKEKLTGNAPEIEVRNSIIDITLDKARKYVGARCEELQRLLIKAGYNCGGYGPDGKFGRGTYNSLLDFQRDHGLSPDGLAGTNTFAKLREVTTSNSNNYKKEYVEHGTCTVAVNSLCIRSNPSLNAEVKGHYDKGSKVKYDYVIDNDGYRWIRWVGATSGKYRYMAVRNLKTNERLGHCE